MSAYRINWETQLLISDGTADDEGIGSHRLNTLSCFPAHIQTEDTLVTPFPFLSEAVNTYHVVHRGFDGTTLEVKPVE
jgi:hypothetical protein